MDPRSYRLISNLPVLSKLLEWLVARQLLAYLNTSGLLPRLQSAAALAEGSRADCIQTISPCVQVSTRVHTCIPYWRALSGGRCRGLSATPFQFIFIIDCQLHPTPYSRWPSFPCSLWNSLPDLITSAPSVAVFRSRLKTHLFNISYPCDCTIPVQWL